MSLYQKQLSGTDGFVILTEGKVPGHLTRLDDKGAFPREYAALFTAAPDLLEALIMARGFGCPVCSGDCVSANPPVTNCPMQVMNAAISRALPGGEGK